MNMKSSKNWWMAAVTMVAGLCVAFSVTSCGGDDGVEAAPPIPDSQGGNGQQPTGITGSVDDEITLTDSHMVYLTFSTSVKGYHHASLSKENFDNMTQERIISDLKARDKWENTQGVQHHYTTNLPAGSTRVFCLLCYDANGNYGPLVTHTFTTKPATAVWDAPCQLTATATGWHLNVTKQNGCAKYYLLTNTNAQQVAELVNNPNIVLARRFKTYIAEHSDFVPKTDDINSTKNREAGQTAMFVMTWGLNAQGEFSGNIQRSYANAASSTASYQASWYNAQQSVDLYDNYYDAD